MCKKETFDLAKSKQKKKCPYQDLAHGDVFGTDKLLSWHDEADKPHPGHSNLNYHASAFENVDLYLHNAMAILTNPASVLAE